MSLVKVLIENWPRLQCVNIFLTFDSEAAVQLAQLKLTPTQLIVSFGDDASVSVPFPPSLCVNVETISQLVKDGNYLSFRLCTNRAQAFDEEYLCQAMPGARINGPARMKLQPLVTPEERVVLECAMCGHALSSDMAFQRVLELPSDNLDLDEWFCHHPSKPHSHSVQELDELIDDSAAKSNFSKLVARPHDLLYGQFFFVVSVDQLGGIQLVRDAVKCPQCYRDLGEFHRKNETVKLWNELVSFREVGPRSQTVVARVVKPLFAGALFNQFLFIVRKVIEDFDFLWSTDALPQTTRCLFETSRSPADRRTFLLVNVMTKELEMWLSDDQNDNGVLDKTNGMKVLFQLIENESAVPLPPLIAVWLEDSTVNHIRISTAMMAEAIAGLEARILLMPKCYRNAHGWGFCMSYLYKMRGESSVLYETMNETCL